MIFSLATNLHSRTCGIALLAGLLLAWGCSKAEHNPCSLSGTVTVDEQPLDGGSLLLLTEDGQVSGAAVKTDGKYTLQCKPGTYKVAVGPHEVIVGADGVPLDGLAPVNSIKIPKKYQDVGTSELEVVVTEGSNTYDINLTSK